MVWTPRSAHVGRTLVTILVAAFDGNYKQMSPMMSKGYEEGSGRAVHPRLPTYPHPPPPRVFIQDM